ncbi:hypothetical protein C0J52_22184 [Blattella germanica]|nr:hypothetical protein C0J52_22184 [Blattella germanica]
MRFLSSVVLVITLLAIFAWTCDAVVDCNNEEDLNELCDSTKCEDGTECRCEPKMETSCNKSPCFIPTCVPK